MLVCLIGGIFICHMRGFILKHQQNKNHMKKQPTPYKRKGPEKKLIKTIAESKGAVSHRHNERLGALR